MKPACILTLYAVLAMVVVPADVDADSRDHFIDVLQPDGIGAGGLFTIRKIAALAEAFGRPCILHGSTGLRQASFVQISGALPDCPWLEFALIRPDLLPAKQWSPLIQVLKTGKLFRFDKGFVLIPRRPGLGLEINEDALNEYRVG